MWIAEAPANIALIKYMGKKESDNFEEKNIPLNSSLSYSIDRFRTRVSLEISRSEEDDFENKLNFQKASINRFLDHLKYIKKILGCRENFHVTSDNNFPHSSGIASSASSFAALTKCAFSAICDIRGHHSNEFSNEYMSKISRIASGSSCRSFFSPWAIWEKDSARSIDLPKLSHDLILVDGSVKKKSSGEAHRLVQTSALFSDRPERANLRLRNLLQSLRNNDWHQCYQICWEEFWDMHSLFETSNPHFGYMTPKTIEILNFIRDVWEINNDGPIATVDAGPNVHLLWRISAEILRKKFLNELIDRIDVKII